MAVVFGVDFGTEKQHVEFVEYISSEYEKKTFVYYHPTSPPPHRNAFTPHVKLNVFIRRGISQCQ